MARLYLDPGSTYGYIGGFSTTDVIGTNEHETVLIASNGLAAFDPSFNRGGDEIIFDGNAAAYAAFTVGSALHVTNILGLDVTIPIGTAGTTLTFDDGSFDFRYNGTSTVIGDQVITTTSAGLDAVGTPLASAPPIAHDSIDLSAFMAFG